jgi:hypothetical protein
MTNSFCLSMSDVNSLYLAEPVRVYTLVESLIQYLKPDWVFEVLKNFIDHLPRCKIT